MLSLVQHMSIDHTGIAVTGASPNPNHTTTTPSPSGNSGSDDVSFNNLYPAIIQCFAIIFAGYLAGRANMISASQAKGIGTFVSKFCLPSLLLKSMCELKFDQVNWKFLASILIAKTVIFVIVIFFTILVKRPVNLGNAGLFAIFSTQSNDFAFGYPIVQALYEKSHPDYLKYIYLVAPISLVFLNPIGFMMLEIHKNRTKKTHSGVCTLIFHVVKGVVSNPIVFMTALGIAANFIFKQTTPYIISDILQVLGDAYSASALFYLGLSLVGKVHGQLGVGLLVPILLIMAKTILLPLITWEVVSALHSGGIKNETISLSMYGFLYGTFPTAPSVFLYASQYAIATEIIASGMVACTFVAAPIMFVSAKMMTLVVSSETDYKALLLETSMDVSIVGMICCVWVAGVFVLSRKWRRIPHQFTLCLIFSQFLACLGMVLYRTLDVDDTWQHYAQFVILLIGVLSSRCWTAMIAVAICLERVKSLCYVLRIRAWLILFGFGVPMLSTGILLIAANDHTKNEIDPSFHYGVDQTILSVVILFMCLVISVVALVLHQRADRYYNRQRQPTISHDEEDFKMIDDETTENLISNATTTDRNGSINSDPDDRIEELAKRAANKGGRRLSSAPNCHNCENSVAIRCAVAKDVKSIEDIIPFPNSMDSMGSSTTSEGADSMTSLLHEVIDDNTCVTACNDQQRQECVGLLRHYTSLTASKDDQPEGQDKFEQGDMQLARHLILLLLLCLSMFIGLFLCVWRIFNKETSGIYVEIEFIDGVFNYGQGFLVFALFGLDSQLIVVPFVKRWRRMMYGVEVVSLPKTSDLDEETKHVCDQFVRYHKDNCIKEIVKDLRYRLRQYKDVFTGTDLSEWLLEAGLVQDRGEALTYGRTLLIGRVIRHVKNEHHFHDMPYFYTFVDSNEEEA